MVAVPIRVPRPRPAPDPARPLGAWVPVCLVGLGVMLSLLGWATGARVDAVTESAERAGTSAAVEQWEAAQADVRAQRAANERDGLAALVVYRCDTGTITDPGLCDTARRLR